MAYVFPEESNDLDVMLSDSLHTITASSITRPCFYVLETWEVNMPGSDAAQVLQMESVAIKTDHFPDMVEGAIVTIAEGAVWQRDYSVLRILSSGSMSELLLQRI